MGPIQPHPPLVRRPDGTLYSTLYGDVFKSRAGAREEARAVFVQGCDLPERWRSRRRFSVLELGFGAGVNFVETAHAFSQTRSAGGRLDYVAIEKHPLRPGDLATAHLDAGLPARWSERLLGRWPLPIAGLHRIDFDDASVRLWLAFGDALEWLPSLSVSIDACFIDGFAPARNAELWEVPTCKAIARLCAPGATLASYSAAGSFREALAQAGFEVRRLPGFGGKRHRIEARFAPRWTPRRRADPWSGTHDLQPAVERRAAVIGAGLAGTAMAAALGARGWQVHLYDGQASEAREGSAQPICVDHLHVSPDDNLLARLTRHAISTAFAVRWSGRDAHDAIGKLVVARDAREEARLHALVARAMLPSEWMSVLDASAASERSGLSLAHGGLWLPLAGAASPQHACARWLEAAGPALVRRFGERVERVERAAPVEPEPSGVRWRVHTSAGGSLGYPIVVLANAMGAPTLAALSTPALRRVGGQTTLVAGAGLDRLRCAIGGDAYACPAAHGTVLIGATFDDDACASPHAQADDSNLARLSRVLGTPPSTPTRLGSYRGYRAVAPDRLPMIGPMPDERLARANAAMHRRDDRLPIARQPGLYAACAFGSRGLLWAPFAAEIVAALIDGEPLPLQRDLLEAIDPARFIRRALRAGR